MHALLNRPEGATLSTVFKRFSQIKSKCYSFLSASESSTTSTSTMFSDTFAQLIYLSLHMQCICGYNVKSKNIIMAIANFVVNVYKEQQNLRTNILS